jgi:mono/diheme cytochrome c family protein
MRESGSLKQAKTERIAVGIEATFGVDPRRNALGTLLAKTAICLFLLVSLGCGQYGGDVSKDSKADFFVTAPPGRSVETESVPVAIHLGMAEAEAISEMDIEITNNAPLLGFAYGTTEVVWTATDPSGNQVTDLQRVTVSEPAPFVGDPIRGQVAYVANCQACHSANIGANVSGIQAGSTMGAIDNALDNVTAMQSRRYLLDEPQTIADIASYIAAWQPVGPPTSTACGVDEDPMQATTLQRLSKVQYTNTIRDLLRRRLNGSVADDIFDGVSGAIAALPNDHAAGNFAGMDQSMSADHMEGFLNVAFDIATAVVDSNSVLIDFVGESCATNAWDTACRQRFIENFGEVALRHPLTNQEVNFYAGASDYRELIATMLMAPSFLTLEQYRGSEDPSASYVTMLSPYELVSKLSYHFWQTMPDQRLMNDAASGEIMTNYDGIVTRVFNDSRTRANMPEFFGGWLRIDEIPEFDLSKPERDNFLSVDYGTGTDLPANLNLAVYRQAAIDEVLAFIDYTTFVENGSLEDLFTSTSSFATDPYLARAYGVTPWAGGNATPVPFTSSQPRSGLLSRAALQMYGDFESHPILKGARIRTEILCDELAAPDDIGTPAQAVIHPNFSKRELTEAITEIPGTACAGCHEPLINPVGFPSETFDALGRHRTEEVLYDDNGVEQYRVRVHTDTVPRIDPSDPDTVMNAIELGQLVGTSPKTSSCFARHYYRFSQRRMEVDSTDLCEVNVLEEALASDGIQGMLKAAVLLPEFKLRAMPN